jgi:hypothetical protein
MGRGRAAALALGALSTGCLDAQASDRAGYSEHVLAAETPVPRASKDAVFARRIEIGDNVTGSVPLKSAYAEGETVRYWELGAAKGSTVPAYQLMECAADGTPVAGSELEHPLIVDSVPGDADYTQLWAVLPVCITTLYRGEVLSSVSALNDAVEMGLVGEAGEAVRHAYLPILADGASLASFPGTVREAYYRGFALSYLDFGARSDVTLTDGRLSTPSVYELMLPSAKSPSKLVFAVGPASQKAGPIWAQVTVVVSETADLSTLNAEADLVTIGEDKSMKPASSVVIAAFAAGTRVARPFADTEAAP